jgi:hypothetical protein
MPPKLRPVSLEAVAARIDLRPETVDLNAVKNICTRMGEDARFDGHQELKVHAYEMANVVQDLIEIPKPGDMVSSARLIADADIAVRDAAGLRDAVADAYDRFHSATAQATEALEILTAWTVMLESADFGLRTRPLAA